VLGYIPSSYLKSILYTGISFDTAISVAVYSICSFFVRVHSTEGNSFQWQYKGMAQVLFGREWFFPLSPFFTVVVVTLLEDAE
jgi:hypothetical protein